ncbi:MAG: hypothetical protein EXR63_01290 [Dehalococcoidia bacterium]|nr:hypothetical protein [Dehalococcoidia bacterium]
MIEPPAPAGLPVLRIVGPAASGKTLLITTLIEALRRRGHRVASAAPRRGSAGGATVITLASGGRVTVERVLPLAELRALVAQLDPRADLLLAEGCAEAGAPAVEIATGDAPARVPPDPELLAVVAANELAGDFARFGPGETRGLAELVEQRLLGGTRRPHAPPSSAPPDAGTQPRRRWWQRRAAST